MLKTAIVDEQEEQIRRQVRALTDEQRQQFYNVSAGKIKDPDSYATLNYIVIAGLHHFYIGKWGFGLLNITIFTLGAIFLYLNNVEVGVTLILGIVIFELYELMRSQVIVKHHNNQVSLEILDEILKQTPQSNSE